MSDGKNRARAIGQKVALLGMDEDLLAEPLDPNPLWAWIAYQQARTRRAGVPEWVLQYLDRAAREVVEVALGGRPASRDRRPKAIAKALGLSPTGVGRKRDAFDTFALVLRDRSIAFEVRLSRKHGCTLEMAREQATRRHGVSASVVDRILRNERRTVRGRLIAR